MAVSEIRKRIEESVEQERRGKERLEQGRELFKFDQLNKK